MKKRLLFLGSFLCVLFFTFAFSTTAFGQATVTSDQPDYAPRSTAVFTGAGFEPGEMVQLKVKNLFRPCNTVSADSSYLPWTVVADENGGFVTNWIVCDCAGDSLRLKATGQLSGSIAYVYFTDNPRVTGLAIGAQSCYNLSTNSFTIPITVTGNKPSTSSSNTTVDLCVKNTLPTGVTASFSPASVSLSTTTDANYSSTLTFSFSSYSVFTSFSSSFTIRAYAGGSCSSTGGDNKEVTTTRVIDNTAPALTGTAYSGLTGVNSCSANAATAAPFNATNALQGYTDASTDCGSLTATRTNTTITGDNCDWTVTYTYTVADIYGNTITGRTYSNKGSDQTAPTLSGSAFAGVTNVNSCKANATTASPFSASNAIIGYSDNCGGAVTATRTDTKIEGDDCDWTITYTYTVKDGCNNALTGQTYTVKGGDKTAPSLTSAAFAGVTGVNALKADAATASPFSATDAIKGYTDNCGGAVTAELTGSNTTGDNCSWTLTYTYTVKDGCNNALTSQSYTVTGGDKTAPSLTSTKYAGTTNTNACKANAETAAPFSATNAIQGYTDNSGGTVTATRTNTEVTGTDCDWTVTYTFKVTDGCGNELTEQTYSNKGGDKTAPSLTDDPFEGVTNVNSCKANAIATSPFSATDAIVGYSDNCGGTVTAVIEDTKIEGDDCDWTITYTYTVKDGCNNALTGQTYTVKGGDKTAPSLTSAAFAGVTGVNALKADAATASPFSATDAIKGYTDNCGGAVTAELTGSNTTGDNCSWTLTYTYTVKDGCNNALTSQSYTVTGGDKTAPSLTSTKYAGTTNTNACKANAETAAPFSATNAIQGYTDNSGGTVTATRTNTEVTGTDCDWTITYTFKVTDGCGNELTEQTYSNKGGDKTAPSLTGYAFAGVTNINALKANAETASPFDASKAIIGYTDNCSGTVTATKTGSGVTGDDCSWILTYTYSVQDGCNNTLTNRTYTVRGGDKTAPTATTTTYAGTTGNNVCKSGALTAAPFSAANAIQGYTDNSGGTVTASLKGTQLTGDNCDWTITYTFSILDGCGNELTGQTYSNKGGDKTAPTLTPPTAPTGGFKRNTNAGSCTYEVSGMEFDATGSDNCSASVTMSWEVSGATVDNGTGSMDKEKLNFGVNTIKWTATDDCGNKKTCTITVTVEKITTTTTVTVDPTTQQYSDKVTLVASVTPYNCGSTPIGGSVTFKIGSQTVGTANIDNATGKATLTVALMEPTPFGLAPTGQMAPGPHTVTACFTGTASGYTVQNATTSLNITPENAKVTYTGPLCVATTSPTSTTANVTLSATIQDITAYDRSSDSDSGDIRNAKVTFIVNGSPQEVSVGLVNGNDIKTGTAVVTLSLSEGCNTICIKGSKYYSTNDENVVVTVYKATGDFITGGGFIILEKSSGIKPGDAGTKNNFGFNVKYNKGGTNLQGNINIIFRRMEGGVLRTYQVKGNSLTSLSVKPATTPSLATPSTAVFVSKANISDITNSSSPTTVDGNATLQVSMTDRGEPGKDDMIGIVVFNKSGGVWYSSNWNGVKTDEQTLAGGNLVAHGSATNTGSTSTSLSTVTSVDASTMMSYDRFDVRVLGNPSTSYFRVQVISNTSDPVEIKIFDMTGRQVRQYRGAVGETFRIGHNLLQGAYMMQVLQGTNKSVTKLIKN